MVKIMQYGEGNFLRAFADLYFNTLNEEGLGEYSVDIVKPAPFGSLDKFVSQKNRYNVVLRGVVDGEVLEGSLPKKALEMVREWVCANKEDLLIMWNTQEFKQLPPLE